jgi:hypothetical protein
MSGVELLTRMGGVELLTRMGGADSLTRIAGLPPSAVAVQRIAGGSVLSYTTG